VLVEHARSLVGITDATHAEYGANGTPIVTLLACSLDGTQIDIAIDPGSRLERIYGTRVAVEQTTCNYGLEPAHAAIAASHGMRIAAIDNTGEVRAVERADHPFFVATLYQPQLTSSPGEPHPIFRDFVHAAAMKEII
jgi:CTP synthase (UTP-ammonia lyase)